MMDHLERLFAHLAWSDEHVLQSLRDGGEDVAHARELFAHILGSELVWLARIEGRPAEVAVWPDLSLDQCAAMATRVCAGYDRLLSSLDDPGLLRLVHYRNSAGTEFDSAVGDMLLHVAMHGSYHRGQIALLVRAGGSTPAPTDYIAFVRGAPAATRTPVGDAPRTLVP
jgi:uncharacterized damage-inducible protein DinB